MGDHVTMSILRVCGDINGKMFFFLYLFLV